MVKINKLAKTFGTALMVGTFIFLAYGSEDSKSSDSSGADTTNSLEKHTCSTCGKEYEGDGYTASSDGVGGDLSLDQGSIFTECRDCAQKDMDRMNEARSHKGSLAYPNSDRDF